MKTVLIIGGGIAGLTAGIYAQTAGFRSVMIEKHHLSGGECTGWDREGFHIDGCIHWLMGTDAKSGLNRIWKEVGALQEHTVIHQPEIIVRVECEGSTVFLYRDIEKCKAHFLEVSPQDREETEKLCGYIEAFFGFEPPIDQPPDLMNPVQLAGLLLSMGSIGGVKRTLGKITVREYAGRFRNPAIRKALCSIVPESFSAFILASSLGTLMSGNGGRPAEGSRALAQRMEARYKDLGGELLLRREVEQIVVDGGRATGVVLTDGTKINGDYIVPCCDPHITFERLLGGRYNDRKFQDRDRDEQTYPLQSSVNIALGIDADLAEVERALLFQTAPYDFEDQRMDMLSCKHYGDEPSFAPMGTGVMNVYFHGDYGWWKAKSRKAYTEEKDRLAADVIWRIEERFPELKGKIRVLDVTTPLTHQRYCGAHKGSWMAYGTTPRGKQLFHNGRVRGIRNLCLGGQWLMPPGGLPAALLTGKWAVQRIQNMDGKRTVKSRVLPGTDGLSESSMNRVVSIRGGK